MDFSSPKAGQPMLERNPVPFSRLSTMPPARYSDREPAPLILGQNVPNPHDGETYIPFTLLHAADVRLEIFDLLGRKMAAVVRKSLGSGEHRIQLNLCGLCLPVGEYPYVLQATSAYGLYSLSRIMTLTSATTE